MKRYLLIISVMMIFITAYAQNKVYDESIDQFEQIDKAVAKAQQDGKFVICQLGGNWCPWCIRFAKFITEDEEINKLVNDNFVYIHVNFKSRNDELSQRVSKRLGDSAFPCS